MASARTRSIKGRRTERRALSLSPCLTLPLTGSEPRSSSVAFPFPLPELLLLPSATVFGTPRPRPSFNTRSLASALRNQHNSKMQFASVLYTLAMLFVCALAAPLEVRQETVSNVKCTSKT